jgi:asparagine synthase (glutamine-hydrolysing)
MASMCGIAGIVGTKARRDSLAPMLQVQHARGPDHTGCAIAEGRIALGHNRLAIVDLSAAAHQPMRSSNGRFHVVFNGEIYNYRELRAELEGKYAFRTESDTEVLLAAYAVWGERMLQRLNGMFAAAIYDQAEQSLFAFRDRFGVKPLYYTKHEGNLYFASEIKAFAAAGIELVPNESVWAQYLRFGSYGMPHETFWQPVRQLPPGCCFRYGGELSLWRWYDFQARFAEKEPERCVDDIAREYEELLIDSVGLRLRADVEVGLNLSGGLDSSTLLASVGEASCRPCALRAYSFGTGDQRYDEFPWVEELIAATATPLQKVLLGVDEVPQLAREMAAIQDEPYGGIPTLAYYKLFKAARRNGTLALLDGQGMDEQWAGYDYYSSAEPGVVQGIVDRPTREQVLAPEFARLAAKPIYPRPFDSRIKNLQYRDLFFTKLPRALRFNDRLSMAASVELREPFLDYRLVELAFAQPDDFKVRRGQRKWVLRRLAEKHLGHRMATAPKRPLQTPQREWLGDQLAEFVGEQLERIAGSPFRKWFNLDKLNHEWQAYKKGRQENAFFVWQWVSLGLLAELGERTPRPSSKMHTIHPAHKDVPGSRKTIDRDRRSAFAYRSG